MNKNVKLSERYSLSSFIEGVADRHGRLFLSELGQADLSGVRVLHQGLDTVRQLYSGELIPALYSEVQRLYGEGFGECIEIGGMTWLIGSGGASGYSFRLQNSDIGLIVFLKSRHLEGSVKGSHLKIECSPHWLIGRDSADIQNDLRALASLFMTSIEPVGCAVHLAVDVQGWKPSVDFSDCLVTRARRMVSHESSNVVYMDMGSVAMTYNKGQSYLIGSASSCQLAVYRKDVQAKAVDKLDFWRDVWNRAAGDDFDKSAFDEAAPVWRIELRFHQSVMEDFARGNLEADSKNCCMSSWRTLGGLAKNLTGLWRYGLDCFRLEQQGASIRARWLDPFWQLLNEDVVFFCRDAVIPFKRVKKSPGLGNERNLLICVGNYISIAARYRWSAKRVIEGMQAAGIYDDLFFYMQRKAWADYRNFKESEIFQMVEKNINLRILQGRAA